MVKINNEIPLIIIDWARSISLRNPIKMASFYRDDAILVGTYSKPMEYGIREITKYFEDFLDVKSISCTILENTNQNYGDTTVSNGVYQFVLNGQKVLARYTYVIKLTNNRMRILTHHSSEL